MSESVRQDEVPPLVRGRIARRVRRVARRVVGPAATRLIRNRPGSRAKWGTMRRLEPFSNQYGWDRGTPVDRFYIEQFLDSQRDAIRGDVLEIRDSHYTDRFADGQVTQRHVLDIDTANRQATVIADLCEPASLTESSYDAVILTQTLHFMPDDTVALTNLWRSLRIGGALLVTVPSVSRIDNELPASDCWRFTPLGFELRLKAACPDAQIGVFSYGNVLSSVGFLMGLAQEEFEPEELQHSDPRFPLLVGAVVRKLAPTT